MGAEMESKHLMFPFNAWNMAVIDAWIWEMFVSPARLCEPIPALDLSPKHCRHQELIALFWGQTRGQDSEHQQAAVHKVEQGRGGKWGSKGGHIPFAHPGKSTPEFHYIIAIQLTSNYVSSQKAQTFELKSRGQFLLLNQGGRENICSMADPSLHLNLLEKKNCSSDT